MQWDSNWNFCMTLERIEDAKLQLAGSAFEFLQRSVRELPESTKYSVIHFATAIELILKVRLMHEHWTLIVENSDKAEVTQFLTGKCKTVGIQQAINRLEKVCEIRIPAEAKDTFNKVSQHRNQMIHFFHEAGEEAAAEDERRKVAIEQCTAWFYLQRLLRSWRDVFPEHAQIVSAVQYQMKHNQDYLGVAYAALAPELAAARTAGTRFDTCSACGYDTAVISEKSDEVSEHTCKVCLVIESFVNIDCPSCEERVSLVGDNGDNRKCPVCDEVIDTKTLFSMLDQSHNDPMDFQSINCAYCGTMGYVATHADIFICAHCLHTEDYAPNCDYCNEQQIGGGDLEFSMLTGCEFCDGSQDWKDDH